MGAFAAENKSFCGGCFRSPDFPQLQLGTPPAERSDGMADLNSALASHEDDGDIAGWIGAVHPQVLRGLGIKASVFAFELANKQLLKREIPNANNISRFPSVRRDLAFIVPVSVNYREIRDCVTDITGPLLAKMVVFDVFSGRNVESGYKSIAIGLILQDVSGTLTDEVVDPMVTEVIQAMESRLQAQHRG